MIYSPFLLYAFLFFLNFFTYTNFQNINNVLRYNLVFDQGVYITRATESIGRTWSDGDVYDKQLIEKFYKLLKEKEASKKDFVVLDLGAQTGSFSLLAKYFPNSSWYSFEPLKEAYDNLLENLSLNNIKNVFAYQTAVSDFSGKITLQMSNMDDWGLATVGKNPQRFTPVMSREIECIDLDSFIKENNIEKVHFMKIDTEGSELYILRGAKNMILRDRPIILMEYNETNMRQCNVIKEDIDSLLQEMGYSWKLLSHEDILCIPNA